MLSQLKQLEWVKYVKYPELKLSCSQLWAKDGIHLSPLGKSQVKVNLQNWMPRLFQWSWHGKLIAKPRPPPQSGGAAPIITAGPNQSN
jgi:hypothetical protein